MGVAREPSGLLGDLRPHRSVDYSADPAGFREAMLRASHNVSAYRRHGTKMREGFFSAEIEKLGAVRPAEWKAMSPEQRQRALDEAERKQKGA